MNSHDRADNDLTTGAVVVGIDGSPSALQALEWAVDQAVADRRALTLVHAHGVPTPDWTGAIAADPQAAYTVMRRAGQELLDHAHERAVAQAPGLQVRELQEFVDPRSLLLDASHRAGMVVIGSHGRGPVRSLLLGSVGVALARHTACPLVIHRPGRAEAAAGAGILCAVDGSSESRPVLEFAYHEAETRKVPLTVLHCYWMYQTVAHVAAAPGELDRDGERLELAEAVAGMAEKYPDVQLVQRTAYGLPEVILAAETETRDLVVVGAHQGSRFHEIMSGSVSVHVVEHAHGPVAVVPTRVVGAAGHG